VLISIKHGMLGRQVQLVPAADAVLRRDYVRLPFSGEQIAQSPSLSIEDELTSERSVSRRRDPALRFAWTTTGSSRSRRRSRPRSDCAAKRGHQSVAQAISLHVASFQADCQLIGLEPVPSGQAVVGALVGAFRAPEEACPLKFRRPLSLGRSWTRSPVRHSLSRPAGLVIETATFP